MANFIEIGGSILGGAPAFGTGTITSAGVASLANLPKGEFYYAEETVTCASTSVETTNLLIQANSLILFAGAKIGTAVTGGVSDMSVVATDDTSNSILVSAFNTFTAGFEAITVGCQWLASNSHAASGPFFTTADTVTLQWSTAATAGTVRIWVYGIKFSGPAA